MSKEDWEKFNIQAKEYFNYLINNFITMIDGNKVKHMDIIQGSYGLHTYAESIKKKYYYSIQKKLVFWLKEESTNNNLFQPMNWRPFREPVLINKMFYGYYKLFVYKKYYFQVIIDDNLDCNDKCEFCKSNDINTHFSLALYGWKEDDEYILHPENVLEIFSDNLLPKYYWKERE